MLNSKEQVLDWLFHIREYPEDFTSEQYSRSELEHLASDAMELLGDHQDAIVEKKDMVNHPKHYAGKIEVIDYIRDKLTVIGFTEYCCGNVLKYVSRWRKKDGIQDLEKAKVYLGWMIENAELEKDLMLSVPGGGRI